MSRKRNPKPCIHCGHLTSTKNYVCRKCPTFNLALLPKAFWHQFIGLFLGEGSVVIRVNKQHGEERPIPYISLGITLREDDIAVLKVLKERLGGTIALDNHSANPQARWVVQRITDVYVISQAILEYCWLPARKLHDLQIAVKFCQWRFSQPFRDFDTTPGLEMRAKLMASREYNAIREFAI